MTNLMSKISKRFWKLLQNDIKLCYNDYTITEELTGTAERPENRHQKREQPDGDPARGAGPESGLSVRCESAE